MLEHKDTSELLDGPVKAVEKVKKEKEKQKNEKDKKDATVTCGRGQQPKQMMWLDSFCPNQKDSLAYEHAGNAVNAKIVREIADNLFRYIKK